MLGIKVLEVLEPKTLSVKGEQPTRLRTVFASNPQGISGTMPNTLKGVIGFKVEGSKLLKGIMWGSLHIIGIVGVQTISQINPGNALSLPVQRSEVVQVAILIHRMTPVALNPTRP